MSAHQSSYSPPAWCAISGDLYRRVLNREAVAVTKRDRKRGGGYRVKDALDAIHGAFHRSTGIDPYDGMAMDVRCLVLPVEPSQQWRCPVVGHRRLELIADFEIVSKQTQQAKGSMTAEDYINHCKAVVLYAERCGRVQA